jgi:hypothetical protein
MTLKTDILTFLKDNPDSRQSEIVRNFQKKKEYKDSTTDKTIYEDATLSSMVCRELARLKKEGLVEQGKMEKDQKGRLKVEWKLKNDAMPKFRKILVRTDAAQGELNEIEVPLDRLGKVADYIVDRLKDEWTFKKKAIDKASSEMKKAREGKGDVEPIYEVLNETRNKRLEQIKAENRKKGIGQKIKDSIRPSLLSDKQTVTVIVADDILPALVTEMDMKQQAKANLMQLLGNIKIHIVSTPGETTPSFTDEELAYLVYAVSSKALDENKGKPREKPFHLIVSYPMK